MTETTTRIEAGTPIILDTDIGGDPCDMVALVCAAREPDLALVLTTDEYDGQRARLARHLLDLLGRTDVPVVAGADLGNSRYWIAAPHIPAEVPDQPEDVFTAVAEVLATTTGPARWVGCGPLTNLADLIDTDPGLAERVRVTQMGGAINYCNPSKAEHNFRLDPRAARVVLDTVPDLTLVLSDVTFREEIALYPGHPLHRALAAPESPKWARLLAAHLEDWEAVFGYESKQHDPLTLTVALGLGFVSVEQSRFYLADNARMSLSINPATHRVRLSVAARYPEFMDWLTTQLTGAMQPAQPVAEKVNLS